QGGGFMLSPTQSQTTSWQDTATQVAQAIRRRVLEHVILNNGGYLSQACSAAETLATLYTRIMKLDASQAPLIPGPFAGVPGPNNSHAFTGAAYNGRPDPALDRFIFSPAHYALVLYTTLIEVGRLDPEALREFNKDGSTVEMIGAEHSPGMEVTSGSLAQALSQAAGIAMARKLRGETGRVWVYMSDGEFQSGQTWETMAAIAFHKLDNIGIYVDVNQQQCDGSMASVLDIEPLDERIRGFGAHVVKVDGHDVEALATPAEAWPEHKPLVVLAYTNPWQGIDLLRSRAPKLHYVRFSGAEERQRYADFLATLH
ncbi:MAG TPA: 1-deoxy-D-xylulose-5-phosphate synthase N-terminal domain-containing protein, partial [Herpetosiphonaceae bacterium]